MNGGMRGNERGRERERERKGERAQEVEPDNKPSQHALRNVLPPARPHFLKVPQPPQTAPPTGDQVFKYMSLWRTSVYQITTS